MLRRVRKRSVKWKDYSVIISNVISSVGFLFLFSQSDRPSPLKVPLVLSFYDCDCTVILESGYSRE